MVNLNLVIEKINWYFFEECVKEQVWQNCDVFQVFDKKVWNVVVMVIVYVCMKIGVFYLWGGDGMEVDGGWFDCFGLMKVVYVQVGIEIFRVVNDQYGMIDVYFLWNDFEFGDLVFFGQKGDFWLIYYVGIYIGSGKMLYVL